MKTGLGNNGPLDTEAVSTTTPSNRPFARLELRTLIVDDSPFILKTVAETLKELGAFQLVGCVTDGYEALKLVLAQSPDLVIIDIHLRELSGIQTTKYIKSCAHPPVVIVITSDDSAGSRLMARNAGADAFVGKDGDFRIQLTAALQNLFSKRGCG